MHALRILPQFLMLAVAFAMVSMSTSCLSDDEFTTSPLAILTSSADTVAFDTVITGRPSAAQRIWIYNHATEGVRISRMWMEGGTSSPFRANADGTMFVDGSATNLEIGAKDSLCVFLFVNIPATDDDTPVSQTDRLLFMTEGGAQGAIVLTASGLNVNVLGTTVISSDTTLGGNKPYLITDSLFIAPGATLKLEAGTTLLFHAKASLIVGGTLKAVGTLAKPITLRGDRLDNMFDGQPYDRIPGQWGSIVIKKESYANELKFCHIHSATEGIVCDSSNIDREKLRIESSVVHNVAGDALRACMSRIVVINSQITNARGNCVNLQGGHSLFVHCTIANFYPFVGGRGSALSYTNGTAQRPWPLTQARFANCIITGYSSDEIMAYPCDDESRAFNFKFENSLLCTDSIQAEQIVQCCWDNNTKTVWREKNFEPEFDLDHLLFSFTLSEKSQAVGRANPEISQEFCPVDLAGIPRGATPCMGCYEYVPPQAMP